MSVFSRLRLANYIAALAAVASVTAGIHTLAAATHIANVPMLYLIAILVTASLLGSGPAVVASLAAFLAFNWYFVEPIDSLGVSDPEETIVLLLFLVTAIITGQLAAEQRHRANAARRREREATALYDVVRLMAETDLDTALQGVAARLCRELRLPAAAIEVADGPATARAASGDVDAVGVLREAFKESVAMPVVTVAAAVQPATTLHDEAGVQIVPVKVQDRPIGALLLARGPNALPFTAGDDRLLSAVSAQLGLLVDCFRLRQEATETEILRRTDELRTALLHAVSHDLRTPLASIVASAGSLLQEDVNWTPNDRREFAEGIRDEAQRLNRIVANLLDLSRIEAGSLSPQRSWYDLRSVMDEVIARLRSLIAHHRLVEDVADDLPPVHLDYVEIDQVLTNLVENAAKYAPTETEILVSARLAGDEVLISVADRGPGLPEKDLPFLFQPFYRVEAGHPNTKGAGLGLPVAKGLVEAHGGRIWAENRPGGGACFVFALPAGSLEYSLPRKI